MIFNLPPWLAPILGSALGLGVYDLCKKHAVRDNPVMPVLFLATLSGSAFYFLGTLAAGNLGALRCSGSAWLLILAKSAVVGSSWACVYYAMRELPISIAAPIRASAPLWTFIGSLIFFQEFPTLLQALGMAVIFGGYYAFSVLGKLEGIRFLRHRGANFIVLGTLLGAAAALYDKYLLNTLAIPRDTLQLWFSIDLVALLGLAWLGLALRRTPPRPFRWRWSIPATGVLLIVADYLYFYAVSMPDIHISILSLLRRSSCVVTFAAGAWLFHDRNVGNKAAALALIIAGVVILALAD